MKLILDNGTELNVTLSEEEIAKICTKKEVMWFPENGRKAWCINGDGVSFFSTWDIKDTYDLSKHKLGHIFKTEEEAEKHLALIEAKYVVRKRIAELNDGWTTDWDDDTNKYYVRLYIDRLEISYNCGTKHQPNWMYLKSQELVEQLIKELEPELRIVLEE